MTDKIQATLVWNFGESEGFRDMTWDDLKDAMQHGIKEEDEEVTAIILWPQTTKEFQERWTR